MNMIMMTMTTTSFLTSIKMMNKKSSALVSWKLTMWNSTSGEISIHLDWMTLMFSSIIIMITMMIMKYSKTYMNKHKKRFKLIMMMFMMSMIMLVMSPNMLSIIIGWDGLGLTSFALVMFFHSSNKAIESALITIMFNRMGDLAIISTIILMANQSNWNPMNSKMTTLSMWLMMIAMMTKSAQMPFSSWLPKAMAAPTPVSALVHSSTLVTAGVYLMIRYPKITENYLNQIKWISMTTTLMASISAMQENDIKKLIALSTLSQMGMMMTSISYNMKDMAFFHMMTHAMFKSTMFMSAGMIMHSNNNAQDLRSMGGKNPPMDTLTMMVATSSLMGIPFTTGFYSKDSMMEMMMSSKQSIIEIMTLILTIMTTSYYSTRMMMKSMCKLPMQNPLINQNYSNMSVPLTPLLLYSIVFGSLMTKTIFGGGVWSPSSGWEKTTIMSTVLFGTFLPWTLPVQESKLPYSNLMIYTDSLSPTVKTLISKNLWSTSMLDKIWMEKITTKLMMTRTMKQTSIKKLSITVMISMWLILLLM